MSGDNSNEHEPEPRLISLNPKQIRSLPMSLVG